MKSKIHPSKEKYSLHLQTTFSGLPQHFLTSLFKFSGYRQISLKIMALAGEGKYSTWEGKEQQRMEQFTWLKLGEGFLGGRVLAVGYSLAVLMCFFFFFSPVYFSIVNINLD